VGQHTKTRKKKVEIVQVYRMECSTTGKSRGICSYMIYCSYMIFCRIRVKQQLQLVSVHKLLQIWESGDPNLCCLYDSNMAVIITEDLKSWNQIVVTVNHCRLILITHLLEYFFNICLNKRSPLKDFRFS